MPDIAWTRKYRPSSFDDYMGDDIKNMVQRRFADRDSIPNTIMLYGTRGTGKTSMARLMAKEIHCMNPIDGHSCGQCEMCQAIDEYISSTEAGVECPGILEVDAATTTGKSDINDIIEDALIPPMFPLKHKILILDECHQLSVSAQNSLLKVIEEPPSHLIFILCTTDPEKVIGTIHSRMQLKIEVKKKTIPEMAKKLEQIAEAEGITVGTKALELIAKKGDRIPRDCINLLETVAKNYGKVELEDVKKALRDVDEDIYAEFYLAVNPLQDKNSRMIKMLQFNNKLKEKDINVKDFIKGLNGFTKDMLNIRFGISLDDYPQEFVNLIDPILKYFRALAEIQDENGNKIPEASFWDMVLEILEFASLNISTEDSINEIILLNVELRLSRIKPKVNNVALLSSEANEENISSTKKYANILEKERQKAIERVEETDVKKEAFAGIFTHMEEVASGEELIDSQVTESNALTEKEQKTQMLLDMFNSDNLI